MANTRSTQKRARQAKKRTAHNRVIKTRVKSARRALNDAIQNGITAAPTVVLDGVLPVPGAQDFEAYERWIERLLDRRSA